jgi:predicted O-methyltransferase YrrM
MDKSDTNPKIFDLFLDRILSNNLTDIVLLVRLTSIIAARMFRVLNYKFDFVYLDSAHEALETFTELSLYWELLIDGGILFGDDYKWPAVNHDLKLFCKVHNLEYELSNDGNTWYIKKSDLSIRLIVIKDRFRGDFNDIYRMSI